MHPYRCVMNDRVLIPECATICMESGQGDTKAKEINQDDEKASKWADLLKLWGSDSHPIYSMIEFRGSAGFRKKGEKIDPKKFKTYLPW